MKSFIVAITLATVALAAPSPLATRQFDSTCSILKGGPSDAARAKVVAAMKKALPLDVGGDDGWSGSGGPTFCSLCDGAKIWIKHTGWEGADRSITADELDETMDLFTSGGKECSASVDGSGGYLGVLYGNKNDYSGTCDYDFNC